MVLSRTIGVGDASCKPLCKANQAIHVLRYAAGASPCFESL
jgi:hypothetical protein